MPCFKRKLHFSTISLFSTNFSPSPYSPRFSSFSIFTAFFSLLHLLVFSPLHLDHRFFSNFYVIFSYPKIISSFSAIFFHLSLIFVFRCDSSLKFWLHPNFTIWFNFITVGWFCSIQLVLMCLVLLVLDFISLRLYRNWAYYEFFYYFYVFRLKEI